MTRQPPWGVCATVKAPADDILRFAAHHLEAGAHRVWIYLDAPNETAYQALKAHPKCRVIQCDETFWKRVGRRPLKHQVRQAQNATRAYQRAGDVEWLLHADVDEFILSETSVSDVLGSLPKGTQTVRVRAMEALATAGPEHLPTAFKTFIPPGPARQDVVRTLYGHFSPAVTGGFLSHVAGKLIVRTGLDDLSLRIHNVYQGTEMNPHSVETGLLSLAHLHAPHWQAWRQHFDYRLKHGAYRAKRATGFNAQNAEGGMHDMLAQLLSQEGEAGLREFFEAVAADNADHRARLDAAGLLFLHDLQLDAVSHIHFPSIRERAAIV